MHQRKRTNKVPGRLPIMSTFSFPLAYAQIHIVLKSLQTTDYVFRRQDLVKPALSITYRGPYRILKHSEKAHIMLDKHRKQD